MKTILSRTALSLAVLAACSSTALAATISLNGDLGTITDTGTSIPSLAKPKNTPFTFGYSFTLAAPFTALQASINWTPNTAISDFVGKVYSVNSCTTSSGTAGTCDTLTEVASFVNTGTNAWSMPDNTGTYKDLGIGTFAFYFTGTTPNAAGANFLFSGQAIANVPAPAALGLLGIGLMGMGLARRRKGPPPPQVAA